MFSHDTIRLYRRLLALGMLCACFAVLDFSPVNQTALAAGCIEDCLDTEEQCYDNCGDECSTSSSDCGSCIETCAIQFESCTFGKVMCSGGGGGGSYTPNCQVIFGVHWMGAERHEGYFQVCRTTVGNEECIKCPPGEVCEGGGYVGSGTC
jgi:hypothetical protein